MLIYRHVFEGLRCAARISRLKSNFLSNNFRVFSSQIAPTMSFSIVERGCPNTLGYRIFYSKCYLCLINFNALCRSRYFLQDYNSYFMIFLVPQIRNVTLVSISYWLIAEDITCTSDLYNPCAILVPVLPSLPIAWRSFNRLHNKIVWVDKNDLLEKFILHYFVLFNNALIFKL